jgi:putative ABC transport system permease protein
VRMLVLTQALVLGLVTSVAGVVLARIAALVGEHLARARLPPFPFKPDVWFVFSPSLVVSVVGFGVVACVLSALFPASKASKIEPASALSGGM